MKHTYIHPVVLCILIMCGAIIPALVPVPVLAAYHFAQYRAQPPIHVYKTTGKSPQGMTPAQIKSAYGIPSSGGSGTIALIGAYDSPNIEKDLADFDTAFALPACTSKSGCLTVHRMSASEGTNSGWALETALDVEWAHAIAPSAHIILVEAATPSGANLLKAIDYAAALTNVKAISMSWGGAEFLEETTLDSHLVSKAGALFFASSGDSGSGVSWPASSSHVIAVGGTTLTGTHETAWSGSGGGISAYEKEPAYQTAYGIARTNGMRSVPDVAYNADLHTGYPIVHLGVWRTVGGTSAGAPQWAALSTLSSVSVAKLYADAHGTASPFRDITTGTNGSCGYYCTARSGYDFITGLGTPLTLHF